MKQHWYKITLMLCPTCGNEHTFRERVYHKSLARRVVKYDPSCDYVGYRIA
jgi:C4-type Zn-finger protein